MQHCSERVGEVYYRTPRSTIKGFISLLAVLEQNPGVRWEDLVGGFTPEEERNPDLEPLDPDDSAEDDDDELVAFRL
jgi:hypothetical protein